MKVEIESLKANTNAGDIAYGSCIMYSGHVCMRVQGSMLGIEVCYFAKLSTGHVFVVDKEELVVPIDVKVVRDL